MRVLIVGGGAREHALAWKIARDRPKVELLLAPGNDGSGRLGRRFPVAAEDVPGLVALAQTEQADLTIVGPEGPLAAGIADAFAQAGLRLFGPGAEAAQIEASKAWAKAFMQRHGIPTARFVTCSSLAVVECSLEAFDGPPVVKDDALAGGKGVTVAETPDQALAAASAIFAGRPAARVVLEERLSGYELSAMAFCDGQSASLMPLSADYKRVRDGDEGPNTGGMGAYAPAAVSAELRERIRREIVEPTLAGMAEEGRPFVGVLYPGLMITPQGPKVVEFNCRFGDPEAEVLLPLLETDLLEVVDACLSGRLSEVEVRWGNGACCAVVLASAGYPEAPERAEPRGWEELPDAVAFRGGASGRVLTVSARGADLAQARAKAYAAIERIELPGGQYRGDIAAYDRAA
ncbi:MAG TPA: phosphoribosylamine--glycine ligase, partial [Chloroflexota bacterium]|nr:phosphoribosylamine--glycine ligase [Chloroflexota bacterium]